MVKAAVLVLAGTESHSDRGRMVNGLQAAKEFEDAGDEVTVVFDGAGTQWIPELEDEDETMHGVYRALIDDVEVCDFCAGAFGVGAAVDESDAERADDYKGHPSVRDLVEEGYEVITF